MKLLYVEDDPHFAQLLHSELLAYRAVLWDLVHVVSLREARDRLAEEQFDAILADMSLSDSEGLSTCRQLHYAASETPLVLLSHTREIPLAVEAVYTGAQDALFKGALSGTQVMRRVRFAIERQKAGRRKRQLAAVGTTRVAPGLTAAVAGGGLCSPPAADAWLPSQPGPGARDADLAATGRPPLRLLLVDDDPAFTRWLAKQLEMSSIGRFELEGHEGLAPALKKLEQDRFDAILLDMSLPETEGFDSLNGTLPHAAGTPILVVTGHDDESMAVQSIQRGAEDYLVKTDLDAAMLDRSIHLAIARTNVVRSSSAPAGISSPSGFATSPVPPLEDGRRRYHRYLLTKPISVIPVRYNSMPDDTGCGEAMPLDLSAGGIGFQIADPKRLPSRRWVVGIESEDGQPHFATVEVRNTQPVADGMRIGAKFITGKQDVLGTENLMPRLDAESCRVATRLPPNVLDKWAELGIIRPVLLDRVFVCPDCHSLATFGNGCRACGSVQLASCQLIHHFACAHVGYVSEFESGNEVVCPKCRTRGLIVGADFEFLDGPYRCLRCGYSDTELEQVGSCLRCQLRFPIRQAAEEELIGYHANRLDPLALLDSA